MPVPSKLRFAKTTEEPGKDRRLEGGFGTADAPAAAGGDQLSEGEGLRSHGLMLGRGALLSLLLRVIALGPLMVLIVVCTLFSLLSPYFFTSSNLTNVLVESSSTALLAL